MKNNIYGGSVFARYFFSGVDIPVIENMFVHAEIEPFIFRNDFKLVPFSRGNYTDGYGNYYIKESDQMTITSIFSWRGLAADDY